MLFQYVLAAVLLVQGCRAIEPRITDGHIAEPHQFPYQVSIVWGIPPIIKFRHVCGGSIISKKFVLTAGHCVTELPPVGRMGVMVGKHIINEKENGQQFSAVARKIVHPSYPGGVAQNDIAILELVTPLILNEHVSAVKLPPAGFIHNGEAVLSGWGSVSKRIIPVFPKVLQYAKVPIVDIETCREVFSKMPGEAELFDTQICTGPLGGSVSACSGDSGGPVVQYKEGVPEQVGIVSWGIYPCGISGSPSVYTRVSAYIDWINTVVPEL